MQICIRWQGNFISLAHSLSHFSLSCAVLAGRQCRERQKFLFNNHLFRLYLLISTYVALNVCLYLVSCICAVYLAKPTVALSCVYHLPAVCQVAITRTWLIILMIHACNSAYGLGFAICVAFGFLFFFFSLILFLFCLWGSQGVHMSRHLW